jgi:hypothetical protein
MVNNLFVKWGKRTWERRLGYVADYCLICRKVTPHAVDEQMKSSQVLFIVLEPEELAGHTQICQGCRTVVPCQPRRYAGFQPTAEGPMDALIAATFPNLREVYGERLAMDEKIASGHEEVDAATRGRLIMEVFGMAEPHFRQGVLQGLRFLGLAMRPLRPTEAEIRDCIARYQNSHSRMGSMLRLGEVMVAVYPELEVKKPGQYSY